MKRLSILAVALLGLTACLPNNEPDDPLSAQREELANQARTEDESGGSQTTSKTPTLADVDDPEWHALDLELAPIAELDQPIAVASRSGSTDLWVGQRNGIVTRVQREISLRGAESIKVDSTPVLDLSEEVSVAGENGLLNITFSTDGRTLFVFFTDLNADIVVTSFAMNSKDRADLESRHDLIRIPRDNNNHAGGGLAIGPDGYLYVGIGDGGGAGDPDGNGQNLDTLLGSVLRIDPIGDEESPYLTPASNPFPDNPATWLYGVRNPWRISFDPLTDDLWVADVGQEKREELNILLGSTGGGKGLNLGWNEIEGDLPFDGGTPPARYQAPYFVYAHDEGRCSVTGGEVYRGESMPLLNGVYVFADYCTGEIFGLEYTAEGPVWRALGIRGGARSIVSFSSSDDDNLYVVDVTGMIFRIQPAVEEVDDS